METVEKIIELEGRQIMYDVTGEGPPIVFVHGVWVTGDVWYAVVDRLASHFKCINVHLPLGVHRYPSPPTVDHSPRALAKVIAGLLAALDVHDITLAGNDTGGALCQLVIDKHPERIGRLVLTNCDAYEMFPPPILAPLYAMARFPFLWAAFAQLGRISSFRRRFFATVARTPPDPVLLKMLMERFASVSGVSLGRHLAAAFPRSQVKLVDHARLFVSIDAPDAVATAIAGFVDAAPTNVNNAA